MRGACAHRKRLFIRFRRRETMKSRLRPKKNTNRPVRSSSASFERRKSDSEEGWCNKWRMILGVNLTRWFSGSWKVSRSLRRWSRVWSGTLLQPCFRITPPPWTYLSYSDQRTFRSSRTRRWKWWCSGYGRGTRPYFWTVFPAEFRDWPQRATAGTQRRFQHVFVDRHIFRDQQNRETRRTFLFIPSLVSFGQYWQNIGKVTHRPNRRVHGNFRNLVNW